MRALITGGTSYLGQHLIARLGRDGHEIHVVSRPDSAPERLKALTNMSQPPVVHTLHGEKITSACVAKIAPDVVFHLAFASGRDGADKVSAAIDFSLSLMAAVSDVDAPVHIVNVGSYWQFASDGTYHPNSVYAAGKKAVHDLLQFYAHGPISACSVIPYDIYGCDDWRPKILNLFRCAFTEPLEMTGGQQSLDLVYVDDVVDGLIVAAAPNGKHGTLPVYTLGSGRTIKLYDLAKLIENITGRKLNLAWGKIPYDPQQIFEPRHADAPPPGWAPRVKLEDGLREVFADV